ENNQFVDKLERLGDRKVLSIPDEAYFLEFQRKEISAINFGLVDGREAIVVTLGLPKGSLLRFYLPSVYEGFPVIIDYGFVIPF
ncbi:24981_t:CDS:2, partial [Dentiscutata erythropus]